MSTIVPMNQTCTWNALSTNGLYDATYTAHTNVPCRFQQKTSLIKKPNGKEVISTAEIFTLSAIQPMDQVIYGGITYEVLAVRTITGIGGGLIHYEAWL